MNRLVVQLGIWFFFFGLSLGIDHYIDIHFDEYSDSEAVARNACIGKSSTCFVLASKAVERSISEQFGKELTGWRYNDICQCQLPSRKKIEVIQYLHIPKTATSINFFFQDYFDSCPKSDETPCPFHISNLDETGGLCGGKLFSCSGHRVSPLLPDLVDVVETNLFTLLRHPYKRLQSDYYYFLSKPNSQHLSPEIDPARMLAEVHSFFEYTAYPGIANCATKMLNGIQCGDSTTPITVHHLERAKDILMKIHWFGITDYFTSSLCLLSWMYGGDPQPRHLQQSRRGNYSFIPIDIAFNDNEKSLFYFNERFDLQLYAYAEDLFRDRLNVIGCPLL